jgi:hypothetical protein
MDAIATVVGLLVLIWIFLGPMVGYALAVRGWRFRSPLTRDTEDSDL